MLVVSAGCSSHPKPGDPGESEATLGSLRPFLWEAEQAALAEGEHLWGQVWVNELEPEPLLVEALRCTLLGPFSVVS